MKKYLTINVVICLMAICSIIACYWKFNGAQATFVSVFIIGITLVTVETRNDMKTARETFNNPYQLSADQAGHTFSVEEIQGDKIGLCVYGPDSDSRFLTKAGHLCYFWISPFPVEARNVGAVIHVERNTSGLTIMRRQGVQATLLIPRE